MVNKKTLLFLCRFVDVNIEDMNFMGLVIKEESNTKVQNPGQQCFPLFSYIKALNFPIVNLLRWIFLYLSKTQQYCISEARQMTWPGETWCHISFQSRYWGRGVWSAENSSLGQGWYWGAADWADTCWQPFRGIQRGNPPVLIIKELCLPWNYLYDFPSPEYYIIIFYLFQLLMMFLWEKIC